ncbi:threonine synthase [Thermus aquaticus]|jgi:threonine synthase|uniref:Threonine synthase n=1 Tax=Thermus aquaticus (strain ATCC BAA-2747 / Y51MC23) TaxID=498848 RepID=A0ABM5VNX2_THEA5|nr:threonine synthase [Thermus aquaticus]ALJ91673.1 threonine synthase [Thermus aquaticus Y51MC23]
MRLPLIERYRAFLPVSLNTPVVSLLEGSTPLIPLKGPEEAKRRGVQIYAKYEGLNPTGSFKDRGMTLAVSKALEGGAKAVACASTGNTAASAAAYAARAGMTAIVILPAGYVALGKVAQSLMHGARIVQVEGNFDDALRLTRELTERFPVALVNSVNPHRLEGQKTLAFEVVDELGDAPHYHALPVGNAGNITAHWMGYKAYFAAGRASRLPRMLGFQAAGAAPLVLGRPVEKPETIATAIRIGNPASWEGAIRAKEESGGLIEAVTDEEILEAYRYLAREEGIFVEPASAASLAGVWRLLREGRLEEGTRVVLTLTGHGLKDPATAEKVAQLPPPVPATLEAVARASGLL